MKNLWFKVVKSSMKLASGRAQIATCPIPLNLFCVC